MAARTVGDTAGLLSIGQLAKAAGVSSRTIRYYEELGILPRPRRSPGGTRKYPREYRGYIDVALALKDLGFRLDEIRPLARLALGRSVSAGQRETAARLVEDRISALSRQVVVLGELRDSVRDVAAATAVPALLRDSVRDAGAATAVPALLAGRAGDAQRGWEEE
jgi:DNA-binding transcriptional MerR regulator